MERLSLALPASILVWLKSASPAEFGTAHSAYSCTTRGSTIAERERENILNQSIYFATFGNINCIMTNGPSNPSTAESTSAAPEKAVWHSMHEEEPQTSFDDVDKYHRARMHVSSLGHVSAKDAFRSYRPSWLTPFFGSNTPETVPRESAQLHPCKLFSREVRNCLEASKNSYALCQTRVAAFQQCLKEFSL